MVTQKQPSVLVIDDDPFVAVSVRNAVPGWNVLEAHDGAAGIALVRARRAALDLVVLDVRMPHDGVMVCVQIRAEAPELPILPFTGAAEAVPVLTGLGCAPPLLKPAPPHELAAALHLAIGVVPPPLTANPLFPHLHKLAAESEHAVYHERATVRVAVLASSEMLCSGLRGAIAAAGAAVRIEATSAAVLRNALPHMRLSLLVADDSVSHAAAALAHEFDLPVLIVALTMTRAYRVDEQAQGVVVDPVTPGTLAEAITILVGGHRYRDTALQTPFANSPLNATEQAIGLLLVQGWQTPAIADKLGIQPDTVYHYRSQIYAKLQVANAEQLREWVDSWRKKDPGDINS